MIFIFGIELPGTETDLLFLLIVPYAFDAHVSLKPLVFVDCLQIVVDLLHCFYSNSETFQFYYLAQLYALVLLAQDKSFCVEIIAEKCLDWRHWTLFSYGLLDVSKLVKKNACSL